MRNSQHALCKSLKLVTVAFHNPPSLEIPRWPTAKRSTWKAL